MLSWSKETVPKYVWFIILEGEISYITLVKSFSGGHITAAPPPLLSVFHFNQYCLFVQLYLYACFLNLYSNICRFHPSCMGMSIEDAKKLEHFLCSDCSSEDDTKKPVNNSFSVSPSVDAKVTLPFTHSDNSCVQ